MPNYVTSRCRVVGTAPEIERFKAGVICTAPIGHSDAGRPMLDFNAVIPMPPILSDAEESGAAEIGAKMIMYRAERSAPFADHGDWQCKRIREELGMKADDVCDVAAAYLSANPDVEEKGRLRLRAIVDTNYASWYPWAIANWGTKWGAFRFVELGEDAGYRFQFETAWSFPTPIFDKLAALYPALAFECVTYDEGDNFAGEGWFNPPASEQAFAICDTTDVLYERAYGRPRPADDEDEDIAA